MHDNCRKFVATPMLANFKPSQKYLFKVQALICSWLYTHALTLYVYAGEFRVQIVRWKLQDKLLKIFTTITSQLLRTVSTFIEIYTEVDHSLLFSINFCLYPNKIENLTSWMCKGRITNAHKGVGRAVD